MKIPRTSTLLAAALVCALAFTTRAANAPKMKMTTDIPPETTTPDSVETRLGTLKFVDGFQRGVQVFLTCIPGASASALRHALREIGPDNQTFILFENLMDSKGLFLTGNTERDRGGEVMS